MDTVAGDRLEKFPAICVQSKNHFNATDLPGTMDIRADKQYIASAEYAYR